MLYQLKYLIIMTRNYKYFNLSSPDRTHIYILAAKPFRLITRWRECPVTFWSFWFQIHIIHCFQEKLVHYIRGAHEVAREIMFLQLRFLSWLGVIDSSAVAIISETERSIKCWPDLHDWRRRCLATVQVLPLHSIGVASLACFFLLQRQLDASCWQQPPRPDADNLVCTMIAFHTSLDGSGVAVRALSLQTGALPLP